MFVRKRSEEERQRKQGKERERETSSIPSSSFSFLRHLLERGWEADSRSQKSIIRETRHQHTVRELSYPRNEQEEEEAIDELDFGRGVGSVGVGEG